MSQQLERGKGATVDTLTIRKLQSLKLKLPPLEEQKRIVAILDETLASSRLKRRSQPKHLGPRLNTRS